VVRAAGRTPGHTQPTANQISLALGYAAGGGVRASAASSGLDVDLRDGG
jgi:hypothetical protein